MGVRVLSAVAGAGFLLAMLGGCASVGAHAPKWGRAIQFVQVTSEPSGATVTLNGMTVGVTPARIPLDRRETDVVLRVGKLGYTTVDVPLHRGLSKWLAGDSAFLLYAIHPNGFSDNPESAGRKATIAVTAAAIAIAVDFANGSAYAFPTRVSLVLKASP